MKITNKHNLPQAIVEAVRRDEHKQGDYSASQLQKSVRQLWLTKRHGHEIEVDVADRIWAIFGTAFHSVLEKAGDKGALQEEYLEIEIAGKKLTGKPDHYDGKTITDWKTTKVYTTIYKSVYLDWEKQLNVYAYMYSVYGFDVKKIEAMLLLKDHSKIKERIEKDYPPPVLIVPFELWTAARQKTYIENKIKDFEAFKKLNDNELPLCSEEERWAKKDTYAITKTGRKSAVRVLDSNEEALKYLSTIKKDKDKHSIVKRPGVDNKCMDYCDCKKFCSYWKEKYDKGGDA